MIDVAQIQALLALQWRTFTNAMRDRRERRGALFSLATNGLWYLFWFTAAGVCAVTPHLIGTEDFEGALGGLLLFAFAYWQLSPLVTLSLGTSLEMRKLALYPASVPTLFVVECLLRVWTAGEVLLLLGGLFLGLATAGLSSPALLGAGFALFVAFNIFLSAGVRNLVERVFQKRLLRELVLVGMIGLAVLPQALAFSQRARGWMVRAIGNRLDIPHWVTPAGLSARISLGDGTPADWLLLLSGTGAALLFGYLMFRASCRLTSASTAGEQAPRIRNGGRSVLRAVIAGLFADPLASMVEKEIRYLWRSPRFRLPFFMGFTFGVIAWAPIVLRVEGWFGQMLQSSAPAFITLYTMLLLGPVLFLNRFGFDRGSTRFYFWMPVSTEQLLAAKNVATVFYILLELAAVLIVCAVIGLPSGPAQAAEAFGVTGAALLYLLAVGNHMSVRFPVASNPDRVSRAGAGQGVRAFLHFFLFPISLSPVLAALCARAFGADRSQFAVMLTAAAACGAAIYWASFRASALHAVSRREDLVAALSAGEGPMAAE